MDKIKTKQSKIFFLQSILLPDVYPYMNLPTHSDNWASTVKKSPIEVGYYEWLSLYKSYCDLLPVKLHRWKDQTARRTEARENAVTLFEVILREVGPKQDQIMKIEASLGLINLSLKRSEAAADYFYTAVELAELHIWSQWYTHDVGKVLFEIYETHIASKASIVEFGSTPPKIRNVVLLTRIDEETNRRKQKRMEIWTARIQDNNTPLTAEESIERLELLFGPVRLAIIAEGDTIITSHRIAEWEALTLSSFLASHTIQIYLFGRVRTYRFFIDHGSKTGRHAFESDESMRIVHSLIGAHISAREELSGIEATEHDRQFRECTRTPSPPNHDYRHFIDEVLRLQRINRKLHIHSTSEEYLQAIAICWAITAHHTEKSTSTAEDLSQKIDTILWGRISRVVCDLVTSMLVAQHETMHGTGYPYGLMRWEIPLEGKLYRVICAYKTLYWQNNGNQEQVILGLRKLSQWGNLDPHIVDIFIDNIASIAVLEPLWETTPITPYRAERLTPYQERWRGLVGLMDDLRWRYDTLRLGQAHQAERKEILTTIAATTQDIRKVVAHMVHIIVKRHELTPSDIPGWPSGNDGDTLSSKGIEDAKKYARQLYRLAFQICTSPLPRSVHTARIACQMIHQCLSGCVCPHIRVERVLNNIVKDQESLIPASLIGKFARSDLEWLIEFIIHIISSPHRALCNIPSSKTLIKSLFFPLLMRIDRYNVSTLYLISFRISVCLKSTNSHFSIISKINLGWLEQRNS